MIPSSVIEAMVVAATAHAVAGTLSFDSRGHLVLSAREDPTPALLATITAAHDSIVGAAGWAIPLRVARCRSHCAVVFPRGKN